MDCGALFAALVVESLRGKSPAGLPPAVAIGVQTNLVPRDTAPALHAAGHPDIHIVEQTRELHADPA